MTEYFTAVDLFCGVGGLSLGFEQAAHKYYQFKVLAAVDVWNRATEAYAANHAGVEVITGDIRDEETKKRLIDVVGDRIDVVIGGPPCEAFSLAGKRDPNDPRAKLFYDYVDIVRRLKPYMFVMENVKGILSMITLRQDITEQEKKDALDALNELLELKSVGRKRRAAPQYILRNNQFKDPEERRKVEDIRKYITRVPEAIRQAFAKINEVTYKVSQPKLLNAADYGVPQLRMRVFFIGARRGMGMGIARARARYIDCVSPIGNEKEVECGA